MSGVFNWSVKQLFLWVSVEYWDKECGEKLGLDAPGCHQEVVIWDKIITRDSPHTDRMKITPESVRHHPRKSGARYPAQPKHSAVAHPPPAASAEAGVPEPAHPLLPLLLQPQGGPADRDARHGDHGQGGVVCHADLRPDLAGRGRARGRRGAEVHAAGHRLQAF